jgi:hypothetical protein
LEIVLAIGICLAVFLVLALTLGALLVVPVLIYFLPWIIARSRRHENSFAIFWLNLLLGWSMLGWIAMLCWSLAGDQRRGRFAAA